MMTRTNAISMVAVVAVAILVVGIATTVSGAKMAYASTQQTKIVVLNKCANLDDENKHNTVKNVDCRNDRFSISVDK
ncbi:MAG TPA: hypothetical protein VE089_08585 [Nitrososphaeraceae archaeon]|jgi:flagellar basal body-associated protein FliL|nr:hypothetical protein [Nitrososphaeraceae archaeon]